MPFLRCSFSNTSKEATFDKKLKEYEDEEKSLREELQFDEARYRGITDRAEKTRNREEIRSSLSAAKVLREKIDEKRSKLESVTAKKVKLISKELNKKSK